MFVKKHLELAVLKTDQIRLSLCLLGQSNKHNLLCLYSTLFSEFYVFLLLLYLLCSSLFVSLFENGATNAKRKFVSIVEFDIHPRAAPLQSQCDERMLGTHDISGAAFKIFKREHMANFRYIFVE